MVQTSFTVADEAGLTAALQGISSGGTNAAVGTGFGFLLWSLQLRHSALLRRRGSPLLRAHVLGGAIGGSVLALVSVGSGMALAQFQWRVPAAMLLMLLALAVMPHLSLTWHAMRPTLAEATLDVTGTGVFIART